MARKSWSPLLGSALALLCLPGCFSYTSGKSYGVSLNGVEGVINAISGKQAPPKNEMEALLRLREAGNTDAYYRETRIIEMGFGTAPETSDTAAIPQRRVETSNNAATWPPPIPPEQRYETLPPWTPHPR